MALNKFESRLTGPGGGEGLYCREISSLQVNLGPFCNQKCRHCHVAASPLRQEQISWETMEKIIKAARQTGCGLVDITGGAPELHPHFQVFVEKLSANGHAVQVRTNLTALLEPSAQQIPALLKKHRVRLAASLPCYLEENVDRQRGRAVFKKCLATLTKLNELGYGIDPGLPLNLVYNPGGPALPPEQNSLEKSYRDNLRERFGIHFTKLLTITNMPLGRFLENTAGTDLNQYLALLEKSFNPATLESLMCRRQLSIGWNGVLFDCDFNLALGLAVNHNAPSHIDFFDASALAGRRIVTGDHCFACTAGNGSSCGGALV